jgi:dTDP-4-dehydrorhamnose 3,5-epimerase-like enzyme|tara:strand:- start:3546 stop:3902 length:357 start_codon:yes stop_codon:yes gene_type:complete
MAEIILFNTHSDSRGSLTVIEKNVPFDIKRVFFIYNVDDSKRGFHKHKKTRQVAICIKGSCDILIEKETVQKFSLKNPEIGLLIEPEDYHWMENFSDGTVLLIIASEYFEYNDYIFEN